MQNWKLKAVLAAVVACGATSAIAGAGIITSTVARLQDAVSYSTTGSTVRPVTPALTAFVGYTVTIANAGGNTVNNIYFEASTAVTTTLELATFDSAEGATCTVINAASTAIRCTIGQLNAGASYPPVALFFRAPTQGTAVNLSGTTYYAEGTGGPNSIPANSIRPWDPVLPVTLGTASSTLVKSGVPKAGGTFFTGNSISTGADPFTTSANVPSLAAYTSAVIGESPFTINCTNFVVCWQSKITIPGTFSPYLTIVLRQDAANIKPGTKIASVLIRYLGASNDSIIVGDCESPTKPRSDGLPCLAKRVYYKSAAIPGWTPELDGDFEWTLLNTVNGSFSLE